MRIITLLLLFNSFLLFGQEDCIFNNDIKGLTEEWIAKSGGGLNFLWIKETNTFVAKISDYESLELSKGGCNHFGVSLIYRTREEKDFEDIDFWMSKALELSQQFSLTLFSEPLANKTYWENYRNERLVMYAFPEEEYDNRITEGIVIEKKSNSMQLELSYYMN